jgi:site-specific recombinase
MFRLRKKTPGFFETVIADSSILKADDRPAGLAFLVSFIAEIRPGYGKQKKNAETNLRLAIEQLKLHPVLLSNLQQALLSQLVHTKLVSAITESGIPLSRGFWQETANRLKHKLIPELQDEMDFLFVINNVFLRKDDFQWVEQIPRSVWINFFETLGFSFSTRDQRIKNELLNALKILSFQVAQLGLEKEVLNYLPEVQRNHHTAFVQQNYRVHDMESGIREAIETEEIIRLSSQLKESIDSCYTLVNYIRESHSEKGASIQQTYLLLILTNRLQRMQLIADILDADTHFDTGRFVDIFRMLVRNEKRKNSIKELLSQGLGYLAYQIAEHKGTKGHKYITETRGEYFRMIGSAMWGGLIISFTAIFKNLIGTLKLAPFPLGFLYSVNYSAGFVLIEETKSTLATKQPAFTASAVAGSLDTKKIEGEPDLDGLAVTVARVSRSQIASFFGNLVIVFPVTFLLAWGYHQLYGVKISEGAAAFKMLKDQHPWRSPALLYACFTGLFLFISGIIAGYWQNKVQYGRIRERLIKHPVLKLSMSEKRLTSLADYIEKHIGALIGSISLGFFLGFSGVIGKIFGIPFDIRHITIASGNVSIGLYGLGLDNVPSWFMLAVLFGVLGIGFLNFLVSFSLAFIVAVKSRGIHLSQYRRLFKTILHYLIHHPREFILPVPSTQPDSYKPLVENKTRDKAEL